MNQCTILASIMLLLLVACFLTNADEVGQPTKLSSTISYIKLLRSCTRCHSATGPQLPLIQTNGRLRIDNAQIRQNVRIALMPGSQFAPQDEHGLSELRLLQTLMK